MSEEEQEPVIPVSLKIVAFLFIFSGVFAIIEMLVGLSHNRISLNFGVLGIFIGSGLFRLSPGWRTCGLVFIWLGLILTPVICMLFLQAKTGLYLKIFGQKVGTVSTEVGLVFGVIAFLFLVWEYRVLTRPDVRQLFGLYND